MTRWVNLIQWKVNTDIAFLLDFQHIVRIHEFLCVIRWLEIDSREQSDEKLVCKVSIPNFLSSSVKNMSRSCFIPNRAVTISDFHFMVLYYYNNIITISVSNEQIMLEIKFLFNLFCVYKPFLVNKSLLKF